MFLVFSSSLMVSAWEACNSATCRLRSEIQLLVTIVTWNQQRPLDSKTSTRFDLKFFAYSQNTDSPESFILPFFTRKVSTVTFSEGGCTLSRSQNDKPSNI